MRLLAWTVLITACARMQTVRPQAGDMQVFRVGLQSILGPQWNDTFGPYLSNSTQYNFETVTYTNDAMMLQDAATGFLNLTFAGPVQYLCLALAAATSDGIAELVSSSYIDGSPVEKLAGSIVTMANSSVRSIGDLHGRVVLAGPISSLTTFAAQWSVVIQGGLDLFRDTRGVFLQPNITLILPHLMAGVGDAAFVPSSYLERYYPGSPMFRVVNPQTSPGFPYQHSTPLYPNAVLSALDTTPFFARRSIADALFAIPPNDTLAQQGAYYGFTPLGAYTQVRTVMAAVGLLNNRTQCRTIGDLTDLVQCPAGYAQVVNVGETCPAKGVACPEGYQCVCSPCLSTKPATRLLGMPPGAFGGVVAVIVVVGGLAAFVGLRACWLQTAADPYRELHLEKATVIGRSSTGPVFGTEWRGQAVAVKRLFPPPKGVVSVFDDDRDEQSCGQMKGPNARIIGLVLLECFFVQTASSRNVAKVQRRMHTHHSNIIPVIGPSSASPQTWRGGVQFFHGRNPAVVGKNIKPHHLFIDETLRTLIGVSFRAPNPQSLWAPPECVRGDSPWTKEADVYAFSMLLYTLVHRRLPFEGRRSKDLLEAVKDATEETVLDVRPPLTTDSPLNQLIRQCWAESPADRPTFAAIKEALVRMQGSGGGPRFSRPSTSDDRPQTEQPNLLLQGMFPPHVRQQLELKMKPRPEVFEGVTIFFSDVVGFTEISSVLQPAGVARLLDNLYVFMDTCAEEFGVHKMETIGDGFVAVTNLMAKQEDHAPRMARFALAVMAGAGQFSVNPDVPDGPRLQLRAGMHSGAVAGAVVGTKNLRYNLFGNPMNIASRMESSGEPGKIQLTRETAALVARDPDMRHRVAHRPGLVDIKGQGKMRTCWLLTDRSLKERLSEELFQEQFGEDTKRRSRRQSFLAGLTEPRASLETARVAIQVSG
ncbi:hypothetical protein WJX74_000050 [Apatococcus lobatus]|uniref:guanylate cyclase n=1 Tax=Apatococcus lobatus TaxID=904363 RepID=A0AAW1R064_9CHLO